MIRLSVDLKVKLYVAAAIIGLCASGCGGCGGSGNLGSGVTSGNGGTSGNTSGGNTTGGSTTGGLAKITTFPDNVSLVSINDSNLMVGSETVTTANGGGFTFAVEQPVGGALSALPGPGQQGAENGTDTGAACLSDSGIVGGLEFLSQNGNGFTPAIWQNSALQILNIPAGSASTNSYNVNSINSLNQIVGANQHGGIDTGTGFFWSSPSAQAQQLSPAGFWPEMIGGSGVAVGWTETATSTEFFKINLNSTTTATDLGIGLPFSVISSAQPGFGSNLGIVVNDSGTIVARSGSANTLIQISASGVKTQIGTGADPQAINNQGDVVGTLNNGDAFIYTPSKGVLDMNKFVSPSAGLTLVDGISINTKGFVIALAQNAQTGHGALDPTITVLVQLPAGAF